MGISDLMVSMNHPPQGSPPEVIQARNKELDRLLKESVEKPSFDAACRMTSDSCLLRLVAKITKVRQEVLSEFGKMVEFYVMLPTVLRADKHPGEVALIAYVEYGIVAFEKKKKKRPCRE